MELQEIGKKVSGLLERYRESAVSAYLFGSLITNAAHGRSDVDIAVLLRERNRNLLWDLRQALYADLCRTLRRDDVDLIVLNLTGNLMLIYEILNHGLLIWESNVEERIAHEVSFQHLSIDFKSQRYRVMGI